jgi:hypothetical protein
MKTLKTLAIAGLLGIGLAGCTGGSGSSAPKAATPKACIEGMVACMEKGDMVGVAAYMAEPVGSKFKKMAEGMQAMTEGTDKLAKALDAKFGAGTAESMHVKADKKPEIGKVEVTDVKEEGDKATVKTKETRKDGSAGKEESMTLAKVDGSWYVSPAKDDPAFGDDALKMADVMHDAFSAAGKDMAALADDVSAGKVASKDDAAKRYAEAGMKIQKAMMSAMTSSEPKSK